MELEACLHSRRSIRAYRAESVPREIIREVLDQARWSPSWANTQCWNVYVVTGEALARLKEEQRQAEATGAPSQPDFRMPDRNWPEPLKTYNQSLINALGAVHSGDQAYRFAGMEDFSSAPCLLLVAVDRTLVPDYACFDVGIFVQSLCLAAHAKGLGTCIMARAVRHPELLRKLLPDAADRAFVIGVAMGYPDEDASINQFERPRADLEDMVTWSE
jgi:nitroreductase